MKIEITYTKEKTPPPFPKMMAKHYKDGNVMIVLFHDTNKGTVILPPVPTSIFSVGEYRTDWQMFDFEDLTCSVTLRQ